MKIFLEAILPKIISYSEKLDKLSLLIDEPWVIHDESENLTKFIFKKEGTLLVSENGNITLGNWELLNKANSIIINYKNAMKLYNHGFIDEAVVILKLDGGKDYFVLVNQNKVPDLNLELYLQNRYMNKAGNVISQSRTKENPKSKDRIQSDKGELVIECFSNPNTPSEGDLVTMNGSSAPNGKYKIGSMFYIHVLNGGIKSTSMF